MEYCTQCGAQQEDGAGFCTSCGKQLLNHQKGGIPLIIPEKERVEQASGETDHIGKINKLILPATILIASVIVGVFYYASQASKQASIEKQQQIELQAKKAAQQADLQAKQAEQQAITNKNNLIAQLKADCVSTAQQSAISQYETSIMCTGAYAPKECKDGKTYLVANYDNAYNTCLQSNGLK